MTLAIHALIAPELLLLASGVVSEQALPYLCQRLRSRLARKTHSVSQATQDLRVCPARTWRSWPGGRPCSRWRRQSASAKMGLGEGSAALRWGAVTSVPLRLRLSPTARPRVGSDCTAL